jgi:hypothetical protein
MPIFRHFNKKVDFEVNISKKKFCKSHAVYSPKLKNIFRLTQDHNFRFVRQMRFTNI